MSRNKVQEGKAPKCGAKTRSGKRCGQAAGWGTPHPGSGRCKLHGGSSTGPKTPEGKKRTAENALKHGAYSDKILSDLEREIYDYLWDSTIQKHGLDKDDPMQMATLQRACITYLKVIRLDEWEMEEQFHIFAEIKNPQTGDLQPIDKNRYNEHGEVVEVVKGNKERLRWAKTPNWEGHFQRYLQILGVDRGTKLKLEGAAGAAGQVADAIGWLWGQKSNDGE